jgi:Tol biopolymer transport system component
MKLFLIEGVCLMHKPFNSVKAAKIIFLFSTLSYLIVAAGCQSIASETPSPAAAIDIPTARVTAVPTETPKPATTPSPSPMPPTEEPAAEPTSTPEPTPTFLPTPSPWLFDRSRPFFFFGSSSGIQVGYPDGQVQTVTQGRLPWFSQPWSPDGTKFIFWRAATSPYRINLFMADLLTGEVQLLDFAHFTFYFWSPDGRYLLYAEDGNDFDIRVMVHDFESGENIILATFPRDSQGIYYSLAGWSPDSRKVAYVAQVEGQFDLFVVDVETHNTQQITDDPAAEVHVAWSPVESQLLVATNSKLDPFISYPFGAQELYLLDENGNGKQRLAEFEYLTQLSWSPDGRQAAFTDNGRLCILTIEDLNQSCPLEESFPAEEFNNPAFDSPPKWSPDGQWLAFPVTVGQFICHQAYLLNLSTNELVHLEVEGCLATEFHWSPAVP